MDVSFVIPARNERQALIETIANLRRTVRSRSYEVIVVDDGSDEELAPHLDASAGLVCVRNHERLGVAKARNIGARRAGGDLLVFLDAHVCFEPGWLEALLAEEELLTRGLLAPATMSLFDFAQFRTLATELRMPWPVRLRTGFRGRFYGFFMTPLPMPETRPNFTRRSGRAFTVPIVGSAALCVTRETFFCVGGFEDELGGFGGHEDAELCMRCWAFGYWVAVVPSVSCFHLGVRRNHRIDYRSRPFHSAYYEQAVENALRIFYLHLARPDFQALLDVYAHHPGFAPDLEAVVTPRLEERRRMIAERRIHDCQWLLRRLSRV